jgi:hypothetical protein
MNEPPTEHGRASCGQSTKVSGRTQWVDRIAAFVVKFVIIHPLLSLVPVRLGTEAGPFARGTESHRGNTIEKATIARRANACWRDAT